MNDDIEIFQNNLPWATQIHHVNPRPFSKAGFCLELKERSKGNKFKHLLFSPIFCFYVVNTKSEILIYNFVWDFGYITLHNFLF